MPDPLSVALRLLDPPPDGVVIDAGCGTGQALAALRAAVGPAGRLVGVDLDRAALREAARVAPVPLVVADLARLPLGPGTVDAVLAMGLLPYLADPAAALGELVWALLASAEFRFNH